MRYDAPNNPPAFPCQFKSIGRYGYEEYEEYERQEGISARDYFAAKALSIQDNNLRPDVIARNAYAIADAMLKQREL